MVPASPSHELTNCPRLKVSLSFSLLSLLSHRFISVSITSLVETNVVRVDIFTIMTIEDIILMLLLDAPDDRQGFDCPPAIEHHHQCPHRHRQHHNHHDHYHHHHPHASA